MNVKREKLLVILGPTSVGKTALGLDLAKRYRGELVACDSRQVYKGLDIGTGKMPGSDGGSQIAEIRRVDGFWEISGVKIRMYDVADPREQYSVEQYVKEAEDVVKKISTENKLPIVVGGTGLYLSGLLFGFDQAGIPANPQLRKELEELTLEEVQERLKGLSPTLFSKLNNSEKHNKRRLIRKIEINMYPYIGDRPRVSATGLQTWNCLLIGLHAPRSYLNDLIDSRLNSRLVDGLVGEARELHRGGLSLERMRELGLEYEVLADLLVGKINEEHCLRKLKDVNHQYAKRQMTYFKKMREVHWFDITDNGYLSQIEKLISDWYN